MVTLGRFDGAGICEVWKSCLILISATNIYLFPLSVFPLFVKTSLSSSPKHNTAT